MTTVSVLAIMAGMGTAIFSKVQTGAVDTKLGEDIRQVNSAILVYLTGGGSLRDVTDPQEVLNKLKTVTTTEGGKDREIMFAKGAMIDQRLAVVRDASSAKQGFWRSSRLTARYNPTAHRFEVAGPGARDSFLGFAINDSIGSAASAAEVRNVTFKQAKVDAWVWDYDPAVSIATNSPPEELVVASPEPLGVLPGASIPQAAPPTARPAPPQLSLASYPLRVELVNPNPSDISRIIFVPPGSSSTGETYTGSFVVHPGGVVQAYVDSVHESVLSDSNTVAFAYVPNPETLGLFDNVLESYSYFELGGAMAPGSRPPALVGSPTITLANGAAIPALYQDSSLFRVYYTLDGSDPLTSRTRVGSPPFAGGYPGDSVPLSLSAFANGNRAVVRYVAASTKPQLFINSASVTREIAARKIQLRAPLISSAEIDEEVMVTLDFDLAGSDMPANARIYYRLDGVDPGDLSGEPQSKSTLYTGPFEAHPSKGKTLTVVARVYPPVRAKTWFDTSPSASANYTDSHDSHSTDPGLPGGHIDVDTSHLLYPSNKGTTDGHVHKYDDKYNVTYVDFFNMLSSNLHNINRDIINGSTKFKIIVSNPNLSPGGKVSINKSHNASDPTSYSTVQTYANANLADLPVYSLDGVAGTTKLSQFAVHWDEDAIVTGGVVPTVTGAVRSNTPGKFGEWRNGALTIQAVVVNADGTDGFTTNKAISNGGEQGVATSGLLWECTIFYHYHGKAYHLQ